MSNEVGRPSAGELFIVSAPSGAGKTTLIHGLLAGSEPAVGQLAFSVSYTTRPPRQGEVDGKDYHFVDRSAFEEMIAADRFLEWAEVHGRLYGTHCESVDAQLERGDDVLLDIDIQGAEQVKRRRPEAQGIFILPPSYGELEARLRGRGLDEASQIERRLAVAGEEVRAFEIYDYVIINQDRVRAARDLAAVILARRARLERSRFQVGQILASFSGAQSLSTLSDIDSIEP